MTYSLEPARVLDALGDPTRRRVLELLREGPRAVVDIAAQMPVTRPAVSQHLRVLKEASLVSERTQGTRHLYSINAEGLGALRAYLETYWDATLAAFTVHAEQGEGGDR